MIHNIVEKEKQAVTDTVCDKDLSHK